MTCVGGSRWGVDGARRAMRGGSVPSRDGRSQLQAAAHTAHPAADPARRQRPQALTLRDQSLEIELRPALATRAEGREAMSVAQTFGDRADVDRVARVGGVGLHPLTIAGAPCGDPVDIPYSIAKSTTLYERRRGGNADRRPATGRRRTTQARGAMIECPMHTTWTFRTRTIARELQTADGPLAPRHSAT